MSKDTEKNPSDPSSGNNSESVDTAEDEKQEGYLEEDDIFDGEEGQDDNDEGASPKRSLLLRLVAFVIVASFLGLILATSWQSIKNPVAELIPVSQRLKKNVDASLLQAVVKVNVVSRKQGAVILEQKNGTGFNIGPEGLIITNYHVVEGAVNITVTFPDGKMYKASLFSSKPEFDLAVLKLNSSGLPVVPVNQTMPSPGEKVLIVGNPLSLNNIIVEGKVGQYLRMKDRPGRVISLNAPIYPGNSGSPVFNRNGEVVGVVFGTLKSVKEGKEKIIGLAIPIIDLGKLIQTQP